MSFNKYNVSGSVVLYNSDIQVIKNIETYLFQISHLFVIDNSETVDNDLVKCIELLPNVTYLYNGGNMGIAYALNRAANMAIEGGYQFLLTMDDDTSLPTGAVQTMLAYAEQHGLDKLGLITGQSVPRFLGDNIKSVSYTITSGNLLNLTAYQDCGPFMNELFIDFVDHEYCFRLIEKKYEIKEINTIELTHKLGEKKQLRLLGYKFPLFWVSHNPLRIYYKTRNCIFVLKKYNFIQVSLKFIFYKEVFKDFLKIIFLENRKKYRLDFFFKAVVDGFSGNLGKKLF